MDTSPETIDPNPSHRRVLRNAAYLAISQIAVMPLSVLANAIAAHYFGPTVFGYWYLAGTITAFGFLFVGWGHDAVLPAEIARDHRVAGTMLGSSLAWRAIMSVVVYVILATGCYFLNYDATFQWALGLTCLIFLLTYFIAGVKDAIRGLERTDIPAIVHVGQQLLATLLIVLAIWLGGGLRATLLVQSVAAVVVLLALWPQLGPVGVGALSVRWDSVRVLFVGGAPFVMFGLAMQLQPNIDAVFLSKMAPIEVMGWYAVARRLVGVLVLPASTLVSALYPTLCRLHATDRDGFSQTTSSALRHVTMLVVPVALGCALFPEIGVALFSRESFRPAEDNLRVLAIFIALLYFSMPLGIAIMAAGKQRAWSVVQCLGVAASLALDPVLVPYFQRRMGNGGLGLCVASVVSEAMVIVFAVMLAPRAVFNRTLGHLCMVALAGGVAMFVTARVTGALTPYVAAPLSVIAYTVVLWVTGGIDREQRDFVREKVGKVVLRLSPSARNS